MKKVSLLFVFMYSAVFSADSAPVNEGAQTTDEFLEPAEPERSVGGAYYGVGVALSRISHNLKASKIGATGRTEFRSNKNQFDVSLIGGFGAAFHKRYYAGIEMDFFKRLNGGTSYSSDKQIGIKHSSTLGLNMDVRFGYLYPQQGYLAYVTVGFARVLGRGLFDSGSCYSEGSFGSFYPTLGVGVEKKVNHLWNVRADVRFSITVKDDDKHLRGTNWNYEGKPGRTALRISVTRSI
ncbi:MAG: hypothetical protein LBJ96_04610 [Holosporaceae bacterium]|nr:hypothetical protein [Holosporaceae bacterium]